MRLRRWHHLIGIVGNDAPPGFAFFQITGGDGLRAAEVGGRARERIEPQVGTPPVLVGTVAVETGLGKNGADVAVEFDGPVRRSALRHRPFRESGMFHRTGRLDHLPRIALTRDGESRGSRGGPGGLAVSRRSGHSRHDRIPVAGCGGVGRGFPHGCDGKQAAEASRHGQPGQAGSSPCFPRHGRGRFGELERNRRTRDRVAGRREPGLELAMVEIGIEGLGRAPQQCLKGLPLPLAEGALAQQREPVIQLFPVVHGLRDFKKVLHRVRGAIRARHTRSGSASPGGGAGRWRWD